MRQGVVLVILLIAGVVALYLANGQRLSVMAQNPQETGRAGNFENQNQDENTGIVRRSRFEYAVKFVCGKEPNPLPNEREEGPVKPGNYATAVNIHNPLFKDAIVVKKAVLSLREPEQGRPSNFIRMVLNPDGATEADCPEIRKLLGIDKPDQFLKGFFVIFSNQELDVTAVYTAQSLDASGSPTGMSIDVETIPGRKL